MVQAVRYLDAARLRRALAAGLSELIKERQYLNRINVFPVPDGDTGNNLAQTARAALGPLATDSYGSVKELMTAVADAALDGAQGNSGAILAQFFQSLAENVPAKANITTRDFSHALSEAAVATRGALENPREGTIITLIDAIARAARESQSKDFAELLLLLRDTARQALAATTEQLEELRRAGVVDAGAHGLYTIIQGCVEFLRDGSIETVIVPDTETVFSNATAIHHAAEDFTYRYCTECLLSDATMEIPALRKLLHTHGDSLVIAGSQRRMRIHIHSNNPEAVFDLAKQHGTVDKTKADDMIGQARTLHRSNRDVVITTDTAADIPETIASELDIHMVPLRVQFGEESYLDKTGMSPSEFRDQLRQTANRPGTSQPTQGDFRRMFDFLGTHFKQVVSINLSSQLSGTWQGANSAAERSDTADRITIVDSANVSVGQGLLVAHAAQLAADGKKGDELLRLIALERGRIRTFALVTDLSNAVRSGRVKPALKILANGLRITPVLTNTPAGKIGVCGYIPGRFRLIERFARLVARQLDTEKRWKLAIARSEEQADKGDAFAAALRQSNPMLEVAWQTDIGPAFGVHAGMDAIVVAIQQLDAD